MHPIPLFDAMIVFSVGGSPEIGCAKPQATDRAREGRKNDEGNAIAIVHVSRVEHTRRGPHPAFSLGSDGSV